MNAMTHEMAFRIASLDKCQGESRMDFMRRVNREYESHGGRAPMPYAEVDIRATALHEAIHKAGREAADWAILGHSFNWAYLTLHQDIALFKKSMSEGSEQDMKEIVKAASRRGLLHLLTDGLSPKIIKMLAVWTAEQ